MFSKISRYRDLPDIVTIDAKGRALASKGLRLAATIPGKMQHTIEQGDRLDQLAYKYYKQPRDWWRIADANPDFLSPETLLGNEPEATVEVPLTWEGPLPPWSDFGRALSARPGVHTALLGTGEGLVPTIEILDGSLAFDIDPALTAELDLSAESQQISPALGAALLVEGVSFGDDVRLEKPDAVTWRAIDRQAREVFTFRHFVSEGLLNVYESVVRNDWAATIRYNELVVTLSSLLGAIEAAGFAVGPTRHVTRIGKPIHVPARRG